MTGKVLCLSSKLLWDYPMTVSFDSLCPTVFRLYRQCILNKTKLLYRVYRTRLLGVECPGLYNRTFPIVPYRFGLFHTVAAADVIKWGTSAPLLQFAMWHWGDLRWNSNRFTAASIARIWRLCSELNIHSVRDILLMLSVLLSCV